MAGCSLAGGLGTSLVKLELLVLGIGGDPLEEERKIKKNKGHSLVYKSTTHSRGVQKVPKRVL